jgi:hypothetical protein
MCFGCAFVMMSFTRVFVVGFAVMLAPAYAPGFGAATKNL